MNDKSVYQENKLKFWILPLLILLSIPYGFMSWIFGITPGVYYDIVYRLNLGSLLAFDITAIIAMVLTLKNVRNTFSPKFYLRLPFVFIIICVACFVYFFIKYH